MDGGNLTAPDYSRNPSFADWEAGAGPLGLKRQGRELVGPCPACGGTDRFAVKPVEGSAAVIHCRQCKGFVDILKAAGFAEERSTNGAAPVTTYEYCDPTGTPYHRARRKGEGRDKIVWQDKGHKGQFYPFRIEHAPDWHDKPVIVTEGEKCAERLACLGYAVVTWCGGTGAVTRTRWGALAGHTTILWRDNDEPGAKAMQQLAEILEGLGCTVRWVAVPEGKPQGWDCADATEAEAHRLIAEAGALAGSRLSSPIGVGRDDEIFVPTMKAFLEADLTPPEFVVEGLLPGAGMSVFSAKPDVGKTTTELTLAVDVARGGSFLRRKTKQGPVFLGLFEEDPSFTRDSLLKLGVTANDPIFPFLKPPPDDFLDHLELWIRREQPALVILDTLGKVTPGVDENAYGEMNRALAPYVNLARTYNTCILFAHHSRKGEGQHVGDEVLGSTVIRGNADTTLILRLEGNRRVLQSIQRYGRNMPETYLDMDEVTGRVEVAGEKRESRLCEMRESILYIVGEAGEPMKKSDIEDKATGSGKAIRAMCDQLAKEGALASWKRGNAIMYALPN